MPQLYDGRLADMLEAMSLIGIVIERERTFSRYENNRESQMIIERSLEIISEASRHLPSEMKDRYPAIPWMQIASIGNWLRHEYHRLAQSVLWETACMRIPELMEACKAEIEREQRSSTGIGSGS